MPISPRAGYEFQPCKRTFPATGDAAQIRAIYHPSGRTKLATTLAITAAPMRSASSSTSNCGL
jgi:hypothetical protein